MVEIAISLAIIGIALLGILGVLPLGMTAQSDSRENTVINQDATVFMDAISKGERGLNDLTNYVFLITNTVTKYNNSIPQAPKGYGYTFTSSTLNGSAMAPPFPINNGTNIIGLLSTPEFTDPATGAPSDNSAIVSGNFNSNHIFAYVRSLSGPAVEKPPQDNPILQQDSFSYRIYCVNAPVASAGGNSAYANDLQAGLHELRLTFLWPQRPNGSLGRSYKTYRTMIGGQIATVTNIVAGNNLYFYQSQSFNNANTTP